MALVRMSRGISKSASRSTTAAARDLSASAWAATRLFLAWMTSSQRAAPSKASTHAPSCG